MKHSSTEGVYYNNYIGNTKFVLNLCISLIQQSSIRKKIENILLN